MNCEYHHQTFNSLPRRSQSLRNDRCQNILYKAVFEHFIDIKWIAALLLASKSFQNSSFGANFLVNFVIDKDTIPLLESLLSPSSCFSLQFVPSLHISQSWERIEKINRRISIFVSEMIETKYLRASLRSLTLEIDTNEIVSFFFGSSTSNTWPQLEDLKLVYCKLDDTFLALISKNAAQLRNVNLSQNSAITNAGLDHIAKLNNITSLNLSECRKITGDGLEHIGQLNNISSLNLNNCTQITDAGLEGIAKLTNITSLHLCGCDGITDAGVERISELSALTLLDLSCCYDITDVGLENIAKLPNLTRLNLNYDHNVTDEAKRKLKKALPICTICG